MRWIAPALFLLAFFALAPTASADGPGVGGCVMGETRAATFGVAGQYGLGVVVYQWMDPATCGFCIQFGVIALRTVEIQAYVKESSGPSSIPAIVSVVGWKGSPACPEPDDAQLLLAPQNTAFQVPSVIPARWLDLRAPLTQGGAFTEPAFLRFEVPQTPATGGSAALGQISGQPCTSCRQYVSVPFIHGGALVDACSGGGVYPYVVRPRGDCDLATGASSTSWGRLKSFYR
jgi:hypothetical protein